MKNGKVILLRFTIRKSEEGLSGGFEVDPNISSEDKVALVSLFADGLTRLSDEFTRTSNGHRGNVKELVLPATQNWPGDPEDDAA